MKLNRFINVLLLAVIIISGYYLIEKPEKNQVSNHPKSQSPLFTGKHVSNASYDETGLRSYKILSDALRYYSKTGNSHFDNPKLVVFQEGTTKEWVITAKKGMLDKKHNLTLSEDVLLESQLEDSSLDSISTTHITINLDTKDFHSNDEVIMKGPLFQNKGKAVKGNLDKQIATLLNKVQGQYEKSSEK